MRNWFKTNSRTCLLSTIKNFNYSSNAKSAISKYLDDL